jgi:hypothetical protein
MPRAYLFRDAPVSAAVAFRVECRPRRRASNAAAGEADKTNAEGAEMVEVRGEETWFEPKESPPRFSAFSASSAFSQFTAGYLGATTVETFLTSTRPRFMSQRMPRAVTGEADSSSMRVTVELSRLPARAVPSAGL